MFQIDLKNLEDETTKEIDKMLQQNKKIKQKLCAELLRRDKDAKKEKRSGKGNKSITKSKKRPKFATTENFGAPQK